MPALSLGRVRALRLISQLLAPSAALNFKSERNAVDVAKHMLASQAQQRGSALVALDTRSENADAATALGKSLLIRSWTQRGTHQILAAEDVRWMTLLCSPRILAASAKRRSSLLLDDASVARARNALTIAAESAPVSRTQVYELFRSVDIDPGDYRGQHLLRHFGGEGVIVQGPPINGEDSFVALDTVCPLSLALTGDAALEEMTRRYFHSRGAATVKDLVWWSGLTVRDVKKGIALVEAAGEVQAIEGPSGEDMWIPTWAIDVTGAEVASALDRELLLPAFDEYLISYTDRSHVMDPEHLFSIGPGKNGVFKPFRVVRGEALPV
ncbi:winged helix DNA-binding domain-containing protein [Corynebacterium glutamicum]|uniref:winged helix DNA-binding domain-containing protein n=1 Tax=Corynebacterium glutamicum TaxID=1718 RepID=UPI001B8B76E7|nr:winged helix DNA-binding domain-containing protein [Corynebacterium glutamicum]